jgi:cell division protein FtsW (lipid II flippase)
MKTGTLGGTLLVLLMHIGLEDVGKTMMLAGIGASVSFVVTLGWKWMVQTIRKKRV